MSILLSSLRPPVLRRGPSFCILGRVRYNPPKMSEVSKPHSRVDEIGDQWERTMLSDAQAATAYMQYAMNLEEQLEAAQREIARLKSDRGMWHHDPNPAKSPNS